VARNNWPTRPFERVATAAGLCGLIADDMRASAVSVVSRGKLETLHAQSWKLNLKPCTVASSIFMRRNTIAARDGLVPGLVESIPSVPSPIACTFWLWYDPMITWWDSTETAMARAGGFRNGSRTPSNPQMP